MDSFLPSNFTASNIAWCLVAAYDLLYNNLSASDRTAAEELMMRVARYYYKVNCGFQENHLFVTFLAAEYACPLSSGFVALRQTRLILPKCCP